METKLRIRFLEFFKDGNVLPRGYAANEELVVDENLYSRIKQSGGVVEIVEKLIPNPKKASKSAKTALGVGAAAGDGNGKRQHLVAAGDRADLGGRAGVQVDRGHPAVAVAEKGRPVQDPAGLVKGHILGKEGIQSQRSDDRGMLGVDDAIPAGPIGSQMDIDIAAAGVDPTALRELVEWGVVHSPMADAFRRSVPQLKPAS